MSAKTEEDWRAESDADTLMRASEILGDSKRKGNAEKVLRKRKKGMEKLKDMGLRSCMDDDED